VSPRAGLDEVVRRKIPSPCRDSNFRSSSRSSVLTGLSYSVNKHITVYINLTLLSLGSNSSRL